MHGTRAENAVLLDALLGSAVIDSIAECIVCPPFVYLQDAVRAVRGSPIKVGAQDVCAEPQGAFTGEVSAHMIRDIGCTHTIVGHSERRTIYGESDTLVARKFASALGKGLIPILCVGELLADRDSGRTPEQAQDVHAFIRGRIALRDATISCSVRILYGGSVKVGNAGGLFAMPDVDGGLIGGASLKPEEFAAIVAAAAA